MALIGLIAGAGISVGLSRQLAVSRRSNEHVVAWVGNSNSIVLVVIILVLVTGLIFSNSIIDWLFDGERRYSIFFWLAIFAAVPIGFSSVSQGIVSGFFRGDLYAFSMIMGAVVSVLLVGFIVLIGPTKETVLSTLFMPAVAQGFIFVVLGHWLLRQICPNTKGYLLNLEGHRAKVLLSYGSLNIVSGLLIPLAYMYIRVSLLGVQATEAVGAWQGLLRLSDAYTQLPILLLTSHILPRFSGEVSLSSRRKDVLVLYLNFGAFVGAIMLFVHIFGEWIVRLVFTPEFDPLVVFLPYQISGDFFRLMAYLGTTLLAASGFVRVCFGFELIQGAMLFLIGYFVFELPGVYGVVISYAVGYICYFLLTLGALALLWKSGDDDSRGDCL